MRRLLAVLLLSVVGCADSPTRPSALSGDAAAPSAHRGVHHAKLLAVYNTQMRPENEMRPPTTTDPVTSVAWGHAQIKLYADNTVECKIQIFNPANEAFIAGHIHVGGPTVSGPVVVPLHGTLPGITDEHIKLECGPNSISPTLAAQILADPANYYVNYHTTADPQGAVRGQLP
jgi:hypothetical protein